jgi:hypothetical protein
MPNKYSNITLKHKERTIARGKEKDTKRAGRRRNRSQE